MSFYSNLAATASRLLTKYGQDVVLKRTTGVTINPVTGVETGSETTILTTGILKTYPDNLIDGSRITSSMRMLVLTSAVEPVLSDKVTIQNQDWNIEEIQTANPAGTTLVYMVRVNR